MFAKTVVFLCAAFGLVAGSCSDLTTPQETSQVIAVSTEPSFISAPTKNTNYRSSNIFTSGPEYGSGSSSAVPVVAGFSFSIPSFSSGEALPQFITGSSFGVQPTNGPETSPLSVLQAPAITLPAVETPMITLSSQPIPAPKVLSQRCICTKTIVRPQVYQRTVTVPKIQRYLKRTVTPVVENLSYKSTPITQESSSGSSSVVLSSGSAPSISSSSPSSSPVVFSGLSSPVYVSSGSGSSSASPVIISSGSSCSRFC